MIKQWDMYVSEDAATWGLPLLSGTWAADKSVKTAKASRPKNGRFVMLVARSEANGGPWASAAEIQVLTTP